MRVFISYRRGDASAWAGRLRDGLTARLDEDDVYQDVVTVDAGEDFALSIDSALERCDVVLAVIGPQWLSIVLGIGRTTVYELVKDGYLTPIHLRRCVRFSMYEIEQYVESLRRAA